MAVLGTLTGTDGSRENTLSGLGNDVLRKARILIVEDQALVSLSLAALVEDAQGEVVGPVASVSDGLALLEKEDVHAAILDVQLADGEVTPIANVLLDRGKVVLFHTATGIPAHIVERHGQLPVCLKPAPPEHVVQKLAELLSRRA